MASSVSRPRTNGNVTGLDDVVKSRNVPLVLWCCSDAAGGRHHHHPGAVCFYVSDGRISSCFRGAAEIEKRDEFSNRARAHIG